MRAQLEPIVRAEGSSFNSRHIAEPRFDHPLHYHPEIEITTITRSSGTCLVGDFVGSFEAGDCFLLGSNLQHLFTNTLKPEGGAEAEVLQFRRDFSSGFIDATPELRGFAKLLDLAALGLVFDRVTASRAAALMRRLRQSRDVDRVRIFIDLVGCLMAADECRSLASPGYVGRNTPQDSERMQVACHYILKHFAEEIDHRELAARVHLVPSSFCRLFKKVTRKTCTQFINEIRLGHACRLLMETEDSITAIAFACGFRNLSNFNRRFREHYGMSPRDYRKR